MKLPLNWFSLFLLCFDLSLLFLDGVEKHDRDTIVVDTLYLARMVARLQARLDALDLFGYQPEALLSRERDAFTAAECATRICATHTKHRRPGC
jgi:hypothetical protein